MDNKIIALIAVVVVVAAGAGAYVLLHHGNDKSDPLAYFDSAGLKVLGNANGDTVIDQADYDQVSAWINEKKSVKDCPLGDANHDGQLNDEDLAVIKKVIDGEKTVIWHINYHDADSNGTMDKELVSTTIPVTSTIMTGSANNFMLFTLLGIEAGTVVKGACYSSSNDGFLYSTTFLNTSKVERLGTYSYQIEFENGKVGSSNIISEQSVTCVVTDWNRTYIDNEAAFESANVDVVRVAAASFDKSDYTHSISLLGLIFNVKERAATVLNLYNTTLDEINNAISTLPADKIRKAVASSMDGAVSSEDSDYTAVVEAAGAQFGLKGYNFGGSSVIYVSDNLGVFDTRNYSFDNIVHLRTALTYKSTAAEVASYWATYANAMSLWEHAYDGQVLISGSIPVPCRVAYTAYAIYHDILPDLSETWADSILSSFETYYDVDVASAPNHTLALTSYQYKVTVAPEVTVRDMNGNAIASGDSFPYGTKLKIEANTPDAAYTLVASGSTIDNDGNFLVVNDISAKYVQTSVLNALSTAASNLVSNYAGQAYMQAGVANAKAPGSVTITNESYNEGTNRTCTINFEYYDNVSDAAAAYDGYKTTVTGKSGNALDATAIVGTHENNGITMKFSGSHTAGKAYTGSTVYVTAYYQNIVLKYETYVSHYTFDTSFHSMEPGDITAYFTTQATAFATAIENAMIAAMS